MYVSRDSHSVTEREEREVMCVLYLSLSACTRAADEEVVMTASKSAKKGDSSSYDKRAAATFSNLQVTCRSKA